jgi:hypothetical protein
MPNCTSGKPRGLAVTGGDAMPARKRQLQTAAQAKPWIAAQLDKAAVQPVQHTLPERIGS